jgi:recombinational DNA repair ATPase RecF
MLLDDVLSELDPERRASLLGTLADGGQALLSTADERTVPDAPTVTRLAVHPAAPGLREDGEIREIA